ncbi:hypothetical protein THAR02_01565 [Trichoderma harzianum]|uniref:Uncharacterized protein n=1 Tax=Trichoderma harzianum TaxID=5544 RepID=A0A0F9XP84_TRIHA|nr:hypothetical protein THAR02_01565 [Trichoderma harzianum]
MYAHHDSPSDTASSKAFPAEKHGQPLAWEAVSKTPEALRFQQTFIRREDNRQRPWQSFVKITEESAYIIGDDQRLLGVFVIWLLRVPDYKGRNLLCGLVAQPIPLMGRIVLQVHGLFDPIVKYFLNWLPVCLRYCADVTKGKWPSLNRHHWSPHARKLNDENQLIVEDA